MQAILQIELLNHPAIEAGIVPFTLALLLGFILPNRYTWWSTIVFAITYFFSAWLILDGRFTPLSSSRKLVMLGAGAVILGFIMPKLISNSKALQRILIVIAIGATLWLIWPILSRGDVWDQVNLAIGCGIYALWLCFAFFQLRDEDIATSVSASVLGFATGICALVGASSLLGELGIAIGASSAAVALFALSKRIDHSGGFYFPITILCTLIAIASAVYAKVPWYVLIALGAIPLAAMLFEWRYKPGVIRIIKLGFFTLIPAAVAVVLTWQAAGPVPY